MNNETMIALDVTNNMDEWKMWMEEKICGLANEIGIQESDLNLNTDKEINDQVDHMVEGWLFDTEGDGDVDDEDYPGPISRKDIKEVLDRMAPLFKAFTYALERNSQRSQTIKCYEIEGLDQSKMNFAMRNK